jgi:hypothetical protein
MELLHLRNLPLALGLGLGNTLIGIAAGLFELVVQCSTRLAFFFKSRL